MVLTTAQLNRDMRQIDHLIAALSGTPWQSSADDLDDLIWLKQRRSYILSVLAFRRAQKGNRIVDLDAWRDGGFATTQFLSRVA